MFDILNIGIRIFTCEKSCLLQREIHEARFGPQTTISIFPQNFEIPENHENPKSLMATKIDSGIFAI